MKLFKKLAGACLAMTLCFGMASLVACGGDKGDNSPVAKANAYNFLVYKADGSAAVGYKIQMCTVDGNATCYAPSTATDNNGFTYITTGSSCPAPAKYEVHVLLFSEETYTEEQVALSSTVYTPVEYSTDFITVTLA